MGPGSRRRCRSGHTRRQRPPARRPGRAGGAAASSRFLSSIGRDFASRGGGRVISHRIQRDDLDQPARSVANNPAIRSRVRRSPIESLWPGNTPVSSERSARSPTRDEPKSPRMIREPPDQADQEVLESQSDFVLFGEQADRDDRESEVGSNDRELTPGDAVMVRRFQGFPERPRIATAFNRVGIKPKDPADRLGSVLDELDPERPDPFPDQGR